MLKDEKPKKIRANKSTEFVNQWFKKLMREEDIYFLPRKILQRRTILNAGRGH